MDQADQNLPEQLRQRAPAVLAGLRPILHHDLPNQLVALHGLLQMLYLDEKERLSSDGLDYVQRLLALGERLQFVLTGLRSLSKLLWDATPSEVIVVAELAREIAATTRKLFPARTLTYHLTVGTGAVCAVRRHLAGALQELIRLLLARLLSPAVQICLWARASNQRCELLVWARDGSNPPATPPSRPGPLFLEGPSEIDLDLLGPEYHLGLLLASELTAACGGWLNGRLEDGGVPVFLLHLPSRGLADSSAEAAQGEGI